MKRYNRVDTNTWILGILVPILLFFVSLNGTYSYFSASAKRQVSDTTTAVVTIKLVNDQVKINSATYTSQPLVPGDTLKYTGTLQNDSSISVYVVAVLKTVITKTDSTSVTLTKYFTRESNAWVELEIQNNAFDGNSFMMADKTSLEFTFDQLFEGADYGIEYYGAEVAFTVSAFAVQAVNITQVQANTELYKKATT